MLSGKRCVLCVRQGHCLCLPTPILAYTPSTFLPLPLMMGMNFIHNYNICFRPVGLRRVVI